MLMDHYDSLKSHLAEIETALEEAMAPFSLHIEQFNQHLWNQHHCSCAIIAEIGTDMSYFKTAEHICSWLVYVRVIMKVPGNAKAPLSPKAILI